MRQTRVGRLGIRVTGKDAHPPRVLRSLAIYMGLALMLAAGMTLFLVRHGAESSSKQKTAEQTELAARLIVPTIVPQGQWDKPLGGTIFSHASDVVNSNLNAMGGAEVRLYNAEGNLLFASSPVTPEPDAAQVNKVKQTLREGVTTNVVEIHDHYNNKEVKVVETLAAVTYPGDKQPSGVLASYRDYSDVSTAVRNQALPMAGAVLLVFLLLYLALLPVLRRTTRELQTSNTELRRRAEDLNDNLIERAAIEQRLRETIASLESSETALAHSQRETILRLALAVETRDQETGDHIDRMGRYCALLAEKIGWSEARCDLLRMAAPLHDVGKIGIPDSILLKPGALTTDERTEIQRHAEIGHEILKDSDSPLLDMAARIALSHHEHWDGNGYPKGIAGEDIPVEGRMAAIADVFDALTSDRVYRPAMTVEKALTIMSDGRGTHFDPTLLDVFFDSIVEVLLIRDGRIEEPTGPASPSVGEPPKRRPEMAGRSRIPTPDAKDPQRRSMVG